jgi:hypothetical protein
MTGLIGGRDEQTANSHATIFRILQLRLGSNGLEKAVSWLREISLVVPALYTAFAGASANLHG